VCTAVGRSYVHVRTEPTQQHSRSMFVCERERAAAGRRCAITHTQQVFLFTRRVDGHIKLRHYTCNEVHPFMVPGRVASEHPAGHQTLSRSLRTEAFYFIYFFYSARRGLNFEWPRVGGRPPARRGVKFNLLALSGGLIFVNCERLKGFKT
jgi:hypothetical protein